MQGHTGFAKPKAVRGRLLSMKRVGWPWFPWEDAIGLLEKFYQLTRN